MVYTQLLHPAAWNKVCWWNRLVSPRLRHLVEDIFEVSKGATMPKTSKDHGTIKKSLEIIELNHGLNISNQFFYCKDLQWSILIFSVVPPWSFQVWQLHCSISTQKPLQLYNLPHEAETAMKVAICCHARNEETKKTYWLDYVGWIHIYFILFPLFAVIKRTKKTQNPNRRKPESTAWLSNCVKAWNTPPRCMTHTFWST